MNSILSRLKIKPVLALLVLLLWHSSCNEWIDIEPENELIQQEFWKTTDDLMSVVSATYDAFRGSAEKSFLLGEIRADFLSVAPGEFSDYTRIGNSNITSSNDKVKWKEYYNTINLANTVMHFAPIVQKLDKTLTDEILDGIEAEMIFLRSLSYFYLVRIWKEVPLVLSPTISDTVDFYLPKSSEHVILNQLVSDLKRASGMAFTTKYKWEPESYKGRANKYSIQALLADILLWKENYNECIVYCDSIIDAGLFDLESNADWFNLYYPGNSNIESLFEIQFNDVLDNQENPIYRSLLGNLGQNTNLIAYDKDNDIRYCNAGGGLWKYDGLDELGNRSRSTNERDANFIYYRYAEILLMKAEALAETGNFEDANYLVTLVSERAGTFHSPTYDIGTFRSALLSERGREFAAEGKRWFEILRFAKKNRFADKQFLMDIILAKATDANEVAILRSKVIDTMSYYLPIHHEELLYNSNLIQNPFYDR